VVIHDLHHFGITIPPSETDTPLAVDANTVLTSPVAFQRFQSVGRGNAQIREVSLSAKSLIIPKP